MGEVRIMHTPPTAEEFVALRAKAHMMPRTIASAKAGISNSLFWVTLRQDDQLIGMGRLIGDGGTIVQITDFIIDPDHQGKGHGTSILRELQNHILEAVPDDAFVCLFSESAALGFYEKHGFKPSQERWPGMYWPCADRIQLHH